MKHGEKEQLLPHGANGLGIKPGATQMECCNQMPVLAL